MGVKAGLRIAYQDEASVLEDAEIKNVKVCNRWKITMTIENKKGYFGLHCTYCLISLETRSYLCNFINVMPTKNLSDA